MSDHFPDRRNRRGMAVITQSEFDDLKKIAIDTQYAMDTAILKVDVGGNPTVLPSVKQQLSNIGTSVTTLTNTQTSLSGTVGTLSTNIGTLTSNVANLRPVHLGSSNLSITQDGIYTASPMSGGSIFPYRYGYTYYAQSGLGDGLSYVTDGFPYAGTGEGHILNVSNAVRGFVITNLGNAPMYMVWNRPSKFRYYTLNGVFTMNYREVWIHEGFAYPLLPYHTYLMYATPEDLNIVTVYQSGPNVSEQIQ